MGLWLDGLSRMYEWYDIESGNDGSLLRKLQAW